MFSEHGCIIRNASRAATKRGPRADRACCGSARATPRDGARSVSSRRTPPAGLSIVRTTLAKYELLSRRAAERKAVDVRLHCARRRTLGLHLPVRPLHLT